MGGREGGEKKLKKNVEIVPLKAYKTSCEFQLQYCFHHVQMHESRCSSSFNVDGGATGINFN